MPTYACTVAAGLLSPEQKAAIVASITKIHHEETGAPAYLVQVIFHEPAPGNHFIGGKPAPVGQLWVRGDIRAGRTEAQKANLLGRLVKELAAHAETATENVWVYVCDLPPTNMVEYGNTLPRPGEEAAWQAQLPEKVRNRLG